MSSSDTQLLSLLTSSVDPFLRDFQQWALAVNTELKALRDARSTAAFPASLHLSLMRSPVDVEALVVSVTVARQGQALIGRADVSTGEGAVLAGCGEVHFGGADSQTGWESSAGRLADEVREMLESAKTSLEVRLALA